MLECKNCKTQHKNRTKGLPTKRNINAKQKHTNTHKKQMKYPKTIKENQSKSQEDDEMQSTWIGVMGLDMVD